MNITEFMALPDVKKEEYTQLTRPSNDPSDVWEYDFGVFNDRECEVCGDETKHPVVYGTSDEREPKFCPKHFVEISQDTEFVTHEEYEKAVNH